MFDMENKIKIIMGILVLILIVGILINIDFESSEKEITMISVGEVSYAKNVVVQDVNVLGEPFVPKKCS